MHGVKGGAGCVSHAGVALDDKGVARIGGGDDGVAENAPVFAEQLARFAAVNGVAAAAKLVDLLYKAQILDIP